MKWRDVPLVSSELGKIANDWTLMVRSEGREQPERWWPIGMFVDRCCDSMESPIEVVFAAWWRWFEMIDAAISRPAVSLLPQYDVALNGERFRLDFAVIPQDQLICAAADALGFGMRFAIELDGHEFHERTREQVIRRNYRDRVLASSGWTVMHVSGSELVADAKVVADVMNAADAAHVKLRTRLADVLGVTVGAGTR